MLKKTHSISILLLCICSSSLSAQQLLLQHRLQAPGLYMPDVNFDWMDMDSDGDLDLFTKDVSSSNALIYLNKQGTIQINPYVVKTDVEVRYYRLADWNADGMPDILFQSMSTNGLFVRYNLGGLVFGPPQYMGTTIGNLLSFRPKDLDGNGFPELYAEANNWVHHSTTFYEIFQNNNGAPVVTYQHQSTTLQGFTYEFADMNGDGTIEHISAALIDPGQNNQSRLYISNHVGNFQYVLADATDIGIMAQYSLYVTDLDGDGRSEIIYQTSQYDWHMIRWLGPGQFSNTLIGKTGSIDLPASVLFAYDIDGNGFQEVRINTDLYWNDSFQFTKTTVDMPYFRLVDTDANGVPEAWWVAKPAYLYTAAYIGNGVFEMPQLLVQAWPPDASATAMDADNDGDVDFLYINYDSGYLILSRNDNGVYQEKVVYYDKIYPTEMIQLDYNGDGFRDVMVGGVLFQNDGQGQFSTVSAVSGGKVIATGDLNNDGLDDLVVQGMFNSQPHAMLFLSNGSEFVQTGAPTPSGIFQGLVPFEVRDINGDGWKDIVAGRMSSNGADFYVFYNQAGASLQQVRYGFGRFAGMADMNGDGLPDIISVDYETDVGNPSPYGVYYWPSEVNGNIGTPVFLSQLTHGNNVIFACLFDANGDGLNDLMLSGNSPSGLGIMINEGFQFGQVLDQANFISPGPYSVPHKLDFDGDGNTDICILTEYQNARFHYWQNLSNSPNRIIGHTFFDTNANGQLDPGEHPAAGMKLGIELPEFYTLSDTAGKFSIPTGTTTGEFAVHLFDPANATLTITTPTPTLAHISSAQPTDTLQIGLRIADSPHAGLSQVLSAHRCSEPGRLWLSFTPYLNGPASGELRLQFPKTVSWLGMDSLDGAVLQGREIHWTLKNLNPLEMQGAWVEFLMPDFLSIGDTLPFIAEITLNNGSESVTVRDTLLTILTCAYDPNDKQIVNREDFLTGEIYYATPLLNRVEYLVRFQNTGNDTARQVVILDNLNHNFDYASFELLGASHSCRVNLDFTGLLRIAFEGINLPDSAANFTGSMGYIKFSLALKPDPPVAQVIANNARILFDYNPPIWTNISKMMILPCSLFVLGIQLPSWACQGDTLFAQIPNLGNPQAYTWTVNGEAAFQSDSLRFVVQAGNNTIKLQVNSAICTTEADFYVFGNAVPDLMLNVDGDTAICSGTPLTVTSNTIAQWYRDDVLVLNSDVQYTVHETQTLRVVSKAPGSFCFAEHTIYISVVDIPHDASLINEGVRGRTLVWCAGVEQELTSTLSEGGTWFVQDYVTGNLQSFEGPSFRFLMDTLPFALVTRIKDTLNCFLMDERYVRTATGDLQILGNQYYCTGHEILSFLLTDDPAPISIWADSVRIYRDGQLMETHYWVRDFPIVPEAGISFLVESHIDCRQDSFALEFINFEDIAAEIIIRNDTLFSPGTNPVYWYYAPTPDDLYTNVSMNSFLVYPQEGYYYVYYCLGDCCRYSETLHYQPTGISLLKEVRTLNILPNPNTGAFTLELPAPALSGTTISITDLTGRLAFETTAKVGSDQQRIHTGALPAGLYFVQVIQEGRIVGISRFVKQ